MISHALQLSLHFDSPEMIGQRPDDYQLFLVIMQKIHPQEILRIVANAQMIIQVAVGGAATLVFKIRDAVLLGRVSNRNSPDGLDLERPSVLLTAAGERDFFRKSTVPLLPIISCQIIQRITDKVYVGALGGFCHHTCNRFRMQQQPAVKVGLDPGGNTFIRPRLIVSALKEPNRFLMGIDFFLQRLLLQGKFLANQCFLIFQPCRVFFLPLKLGGQCLLLIVFLCNLIFPEFIRLLQLLLKSQTRFFRTLVQIIKSVQKVLSSA